MSSRSLSGSSSIFTSNSAASTSRSSSSSYSYSVSTPPPRYSTHFTHLAPTADADAKQHPQKADLHQHLHAQPRWTPLSSHGLPRPPAPGQVPQRQHTRTRAQSVSSPAMETERPPRSRSRPGTTCGHRQTQSLGANCYDCVHHHNHHHDTEKCMQDTRDAHADAAAARDDAKGPRETRDQTNTTNNNDSSLSKLKQLRSKVAGWRERERERRRAASEDVIEVGAGGHWTEY